jgi:Flagellar basal body-associated protein FliL
MVEGNARKPKPSLRFALPALAARAFPLPALARRPAFLASAGLVASLMLAAATVIATIHGERGGAVTVALGGSTSYHVLPEFVTDLKTSRSRPHYLQLAAVVEVQEEAVGKLQAQELRILSDVQTRLRDFQREDLAGTAGLERVRRDIAAVVDRHIAPARVCEILFTKFLLD